MLIRGAKHLLLCDEKERATMSFPSYYYFVGWMTFWKRNTQWFDKFLRSNKQARERWNSELHGPQYCGCLRKSHWFFQSSHHSVQRCATSSWTLKDTADPASNPMGYSKHLKKSLKWNVMRLSLHIIHQENKSLDFTVGTHTWKN